MDSMMPQMLSTVRNDKVKPPQQQLKGAKKTVLIDPL